MTKTTIIKTPARKTATPRRRRFGKHGKPLKSFYVNIR